MDGDPVVRAKAVYCKDLDDGIFVEDVTARNEGHGMGHEVSANAVFEGFYNLVTVSACTAGCYHTINLGYLVS